MMTSSTTAPSGAQLRSPAATMAALGAILLATSLAAGLGASASGGEADPWYAALHKAPGNPPGYVFGLVWPVLYGLMAVGAFMAWLKGARLHLYFLQLTVNLLWSYLFFRFHLPLVALLDLAILWVIVFLMIRQFRRHSPIASWLQAPYLAWLSFAGYLNAWIVFAN